jgi:hypothetical protein
MRTIEKFNETYEDVKFYTRFHHKPVWLVPTESDYQLSLIKPYPYDLPAGTTSCLYDEEGEVMEFVRSSNK